MTGNTEHLYRQILVICLIFTAGWASMVAGLYVVDDLGPLGAGYLALGAALGAAGTLIAFYALRRWRALLAAEPVRLAGRENLLSWLLAPVLLIGLLFVLWTAVDLNPLVIGLLAIAGILFAGALYLWRSTPNGAAAGNDQI
ncbi:MAG: hypothetical protein RRC07_09585 [Anaerolineae bacterium]|nr:hypothetical protein [Anaerolineae bacterium]